MNTRHAATYSHRSLIAATIAARSTTIAWPAVEGSPHAMPTPLSALRWSTCLTSGPTLPAKGGIRKGPLFQTTATMMGLYDPSRHPVIAARPRTPIQPEPVPTEVGPLRNGNPRGDPNAAPRCGANSRVPGLTSRSDPGRYSYWVEARGLGGSTRRCWPP